MVVVAERQEFLASELCPIVGDDGVRNPKPVDDVSEEQHRLLGFDLIDRMSLDPLGELIDRYQHYKDLTLIAPLAFATPPIWLQYLVLRQQMS